MFILSFSQLVRTIEQYKSAARAKAIAKAPRATCWEDVKFQPVPPQEGEEGAVEVSSSFSLVQIRSSYSIHIFIGKNRWIY